MAKRIPRDEMLLARAIAEAKGRGLKFVKGRKFAKWFHPYEDWVNASKTDCEGVCALGAIELATGKRQSEDDFFNEGVYQGNDGWEFGYIDNPTTARGYTFGQAFRDAMEDS